MLPKTKVEKKSILLKKIDKLYIIAKSTLDLGIANSQKINYRIFQEL